MGNPDLISRTHFARHLVETGVCADVHEVFRRFLTEGKPGYVPHRWASLGDAVRWIVGAGGMAVVAHPGRYKFTPNEEYALFTEFKAHGGEGVEVVTGSHGPADFVKYAAAAREFGLCASRGSDFHSPEESHTELGALPPLPSDLTPRVGAPGASRAPPVTRTPHAGLGIGLMVVAAACFALMDSTTRWLGAFLPVTLMLWSRYALHAIVMALWLAVDRSKRFRTSRPGFQLLRGSLLLGSSALAFHALQHMPVAEFTAIIMLTPVLVTLMSPWLLHERVSALRWALVVGGFAGAAHRDPPGQRLVRLDRAAAAGRPRSAMPASRCSRAGSAPARARTPRTSTPGSSARR